MKLYRTSEAYIIAANEIWQSMRTFKGLPTSEFADRRYLWYLGVL